MFSDSENLNNGGTETNQYSLPTDEQSNTQSLARDPSSIYSLTLDEFQQTLFDNGKNLSSMNMDEFLNNCTEENNSSPPNQQNSETKTISTSQQNLSLSMKTVEEVWSEMNRDQQQFNELKNSGKPIRESTFGEMTLEDFLVKAGVVREKCSGSSSSQSQMQNLQVQTQGLGPKFGIPGLGFSGGYNAGGRSGMCTMTRFEEEVSGGKRRRKRASENPIEKVVERKQRRMIKNREAATRSRARKQAYTVELEQALDKLKEENARLYQTLLQDIKKEKHWKRNVPRIAEKLKLLRRMWSLPPVEF